MILEWDERKRHRNIRKHGIDFCDAERVFRGTALTSVDDRAYGEERFLTLGLLDDQVVSVCHTESDEVVRIISIRKATRNERENYFAQIADQLAPNQDNEGPADHS